MRNGCGTTGALEYDGVVTEPGRFCGPCKDGVLICPAEGRVLECLGPSESNACGECNPLGAEVESACGACQDGRRCAFGT